MIYRKDINGLRAIAVIAVILFHFKTPFFGGGFAGVDIFFVISGYLMTGIILTQLRKDKFSFIDFYLSRAKRIIPALTFLCTTLLIFGFFYLISKDYTQLLKNIEKSILFISNISFYKHSSYFDTPTNENWLLHTWSLSVEWQFYIIYPLLITLIFNVFNEKILKYFLILIAVLSFIAANYYAYSDPSFAFYLLPTRAWELIAGGLIFIFPLSFFKKLSLMMLLTGMAFILISFFCINAYTLWPSYFTLLPVIGTVLVLYSNRDSIITNNSFMQFTGKVSYSLYLWHWPIAVWIYLSSITINIYIIVIEISISFILASISYFLVERKNRKNKTNKVLNIFKYISIVIVVAYLSQFVNSVVKKYPEIRPEFLSSNIDLEDVWKNMSCYPQNGEEVPYCEAGEGKVSVIVLGDSHSSAIAGVLEETVNGKVLVLSKAGCPVLNEFNLKDPKESQDCNNHMRRVILKLSSEYENVPVVIANYYALYLNKEIAAGRLISFNKIDNNDNDAYLEKYQDVFVNTMCQISKNRSVYIVKPIPEMNTNVPASLRLQPDFLKSVGNISVPLDTYKSKNQFIIDAMQNSEKECGIKLLDPTPYLCPDGKHCMGSKNGRSLYMDNNHINMYGRSFIYDLIKNQFGNKN